MLRKIKKAVPSIISAILCVTVVLSIAAEAASSKVWKETKALTNLKYNSKYIELMEKYSGKKAKNSVVYKNSRTKKTIDKLFKYIDKKEFSVGWINSESIEYFSCKDGSSRTVVYSGNEIGMLFVITPYTGTYAFIYEDKKEYNTSEQDEQYDPDELIEPKAELFELGIDDGEKGSLFKIKSGEKIYYYEEFKCDKYGTVGFLFTEKGTPVGMREDSGYYCVRFSSTVDDDDFAVPDDFEAMPD